MKAMKQGAAYIPMPKGRGFTPQFDKKVEEGDGNFIINYVVLFMSKTTGQIGFDVFASSTPGDAKKLFEKKYLHDVYDVLIVVKKPNID